jgi:hypothetical protein
LAYAAKNESQIFRKKIFRIDVLKKSYVLWPWRRLLWVISAMTADERFALIWHKIERANKHIRDLDAAIAAFLAINPYKVAAKRDPETGKPIYYVAEVQPVPHEICIILGDAIHNLRTALDHLAQQLYLAGSGASVYRKETGFFIAQKATEYKRAVGGKVEKMGREAIDALAALEPYKGGKGNDFWVLHSLNNIDKHRTLVAAGSSYEAVVPGMPENVRKFAAERGIDLRDFSIGITPADNLCPLPGGQTGSSRASASAQARGAPPSNSMMAPRSSKAACSASSRATISGDEADGARDWSEELAAERECRQSQPR